jgi:hypothetical protein
VHILRVVAPMLLILAILWAIVFASRSVDTRLPKPRHLSSNARVNVERCSECHLEIWQSFQEAPHAHTLSLASRPENLRTLADTQVKLDGDVFRFEQRDDSLWFRSDDFPQAVRVDWIFGSGSHAQTPVSVLTNPDGQSELIQLKVSWYPSHGLASTLGFERSETQTPLLPSLGTSQSAAETLRCFGCHTTYLPQNDGRIDFPNLLTGVSCTRCHLGAKEHLAAVDLGTSAPVPHASPLASINRCGECHRRVDEFPPDVLVPTDRELVRFAPVGLALSKCFREQSSSGEATNLSKRLDCLTCHDPHRPAETDPRFYVAKCLNCHDSQLGSPADCGLQSMTSNCLPCHLPKVEVLPHLTFADHWIRIRNKP